MGHSIKEKRAVATVYISRRHHSIVIESEEASFCSPDWPWHYFDRLEKAFVRPPSVVPLRAHTHARGRSSAAPPSPPSVIQWISQLCIYHYDSIHLDGSLSLSLSLDDRWQTCTNTWRRATKKGKRKGEKKKKRKEKW